MHLNRPSLIKFFLLALLCFLFIPVNVKAEIYISQPVFSVSSGIYNEPFPLTMTSKTGTMIYYTIDGSIPSTESSTTYPYTQPISIQEEALREKPSAYYCATVIRAIAVDSEGNTSKITNATYFVDPNLLQRYRLPIISIITDQKNLFDREIGIMSHNNTKQRGREWERPVYIEYFDADGSLQIAMNAGIRLHGGASREWAVKSFRIYARSEYDENIKKFRYDFFSNSFLPSLIKNGKNEGKPITEFKRLLLRVGGNEGTAREGTFIRDTLSQTLMADTRLDLQAHTPAVTFINGEFYSIHNIMERYDEKYIEAHYNVKEEDIIIYDFSYDSEGQQNVKASSEDEADNQFYRNIIDFFKNSDLSLPENYEKVKTWLDIENFVDYQIINLYGANRDWPGNNCKAWRIRTEYNPEAKYGLDGRIRWLVYDTDFNFGLYNLMAVNMDSIADATKVGGTEWPNQDGSTLFLRKLLENEEFKTYFCQRYFDLINSNFDYNYVSGLIDKMSAPYQYTIEEYNNRYRTLGDWHLNLENIKTFVKNREGIVKSQLAKRFDLGAFYILNINLLDENLTPIGGKVLLNTILLDTNTKGVKDGLWRKSYFEGLPVTLTAIPEEGYEFESWSGNSNSTDVTIYASDYILEGREANLSPKFRKINEDDIVKATSASLETSNQNNNEASNQEIKAIPYGTKNTKDNTIYLICILLLVFISLIIAVYYFATNKRKKIKD